MSGGSTSGTGDQAQADRLWQHALHLDAMLFQRANLFLVAESLLVVAYATVLAAAGVPGRPASGGEMVLAAQVIACFGLVLTLAWVYVAHRHLRYDRVVRERLIEMLPDYAETRARYGGRGVSSASMVTYLLPSLAGAMWIFLLVIAIA